MEHLLPELETIQNAGSWFVMGNAFCLREPSRMYPATKKMENWHCSLHEHFLVIHKVTVLPIQTLPGKLLLLHCLWEGNGWGEENTPVPCPQNRLEQNKLGDELALYLHMLAAYSKGNLPFFFPVPPLAGMLKAPGKLKEGGCYWRNSKTKVRLLTCYRDSLQMENETLQLTQYLQEHWPQLLNNDIHRLLQWGWSGEGHSEL